MCGNLLFGSHSISRNQLNLGEGMLNEICLEFYMASKNRTVYGVPY